MLQRNISIRVELQTRKLENNEMHKFIFHLIKNEYNFWMGGWVGRSLLPYYPSLSLIIKTIIKNNLSDIPQSLHIKKKLNHVVNITFSTLTRHYKGIQL